MKGLNNEEDDCLPIATIIVMVAVAVICGVVMAGLLVSVADEFKTPIPITNTSTAEK